MVEEEAERSPVVEAPVAQFQEHLEEDQSQKGLKNQVAQNLTEHSPRVWQEEFGVVRQAAVQPSASLLERQAEFVRSQLRPGLSLLLQSHPMQQHSDFEPLMDLEQLPGEQVQAAEEWTVDMVADL